MRGLPTIWLKNGKGETWNLRPDSLLSETYASPIVNLNKHTGFKTKLVTSQIEFDWAVIEQTPEMVPINGTLLFRNPEHIKLFTEFVGDFSKTLRLYYDPHGLILPETQLMTAYYKEVNIVQLDGGEMDVKLGCYALAIQMTTLSAMWRRDTTIASTVSGVIGEPHQFPFYFPYFFQSEQKLFLNVFNRGETIGSIIEIRNIGAAALDHIEWNVDSENNIRQYAAWLSPPFSSLRLEPNTALIVDSNPRTFGAQVGFISDDEIDKQSLASVISAQNPNPQYINFVKLLSGNNQFMFNLGRVDDVEVTVKYTEQARVI